MPSPDVPFPERDRTITQRLIGQGFCGSDKKASPPVILHDDFVAPMADSSAWPGIAVFLPTMANRLGEDSAQDFACSLVDQIREVCRRGGNIIHLYVTVQYRDGEEVARLALSRFIKVIVAARKKSGISFHLTGLICQGFGKIRSLNIMTAIAGQRGVGAVILIDDDVRFSDGCFANLIERYEAMPAPVAIGARKFGQPFATRSSRLLHALKSFTQPAENYPHACCMIVSLDVISPAIPAHYSSDDGYICFRLMRPELSDPLVALKLADDATCYHWVGASSRQAIRSRIRRMLLQHHLLISEFDSEKAKFYLKKMLFFGLWPLVPFDRSNGVKAGILKCLLKYLYAAWFVKVGVELVIRGMAGRPLNAIEWGGDQQGAEPT